MTVIRDFVYIDVERLNSLYSQVFEGVVDTIVKTELNESEDINSQKGGIRFTGGTLEERVAVASYKTESKLLYDHMYNLLENRIQDAIVKPVDVNSTNYIDVLEKAFMIKVSGSAEIWDYERIRYIFDKYNEIGLALSYITNFPSRLLLEVMKNRLDEQIKEVKKAASRRNEATQLQQQINDLKKQLDPIEVAKNSNLHLDDSFLKHISLLTSTFYSGGLEVVIHPQGGSENVIFRSVLDEQWLRISTKLLRSLYAGKKAANWVVVGQVTYVPTNHQENLAQETPSTSTENAGTGNHSEETGALRDAYRQLINAYYGLESSFSESKKLVEIIIHPVAIYREAIIPETGSHEKTSDI